MGIKKLILYLELGFLCFGLVVLLLSSIDSIETAEQTLPEQQEIIVVQRLRLLKLLHRFLLVKGMQSRCLQRRKSRAAL